MKKFFSLLIFTLIFSITQNSYAGIYDYPRVAILPFHLKANVSEILSLTQEDIVNECVNTELVKSNRFDIVDRVYLSEVLNEQSFQMTGAIDPNTAVKIGKLVGAQYIVVGSITSLNSRGKSVTASIFSRMIDVETGRVVLAGKGKASTNTVEDSLESSSINLVEDLLLTMDKRKGN